MSKKSKPSRRNYSVLLLYPDYIAMEYGKDTYFTHDKARDAQQAVEVARLSAAVANKDTNEPEDFHPLAVFKGRLEMEPCRG